MALTLKTAQAQDAEALAALVNSAYRGDSSKKGWTTEADLLGGQRTDAEALRETISQPGQVILMMLNGDQLVGSVFLQNKTDRGYLGMLTIDPTQQAGGLGKQLLSGAENWVIQNWGLHRMEMTVIKQRVELVAWYERRGYQRTGKTEPFPYNDERFGVPKVEGLEFVVLEKRLA